MLCFISGGNDKSVYVDTTFLGPILVDSLGSGSMTLEQLGGFLLPAHNLYVGYSGTGTYNFVDGWLKLDHVREYIGYSGKGVFNQYGGRHDGMDGCIWDIAKAARVLIIYTQVHWTAVN